MLTKKIPAVSAGGKAENVLALNRKRLVATVSRKRARLQASRRAERDLFREGGARERHTRRLFVPKAKKNVGAKRTLLRRGAGGGGRTRTSLRTTDFESVSSASSNTPAYKCLFAAILTSASKHKKREVHRFF